HPVKLQQYLPNPEHISPQSRFARLYDEKYRFRFLKKRKVMRVKTRGTTDASPPTEAPMMVVRNMAEEVVSVNGTVPRAPAMEMAGQKGEEGAEGAGGGFVWEAFEILKKGQCE
ncbi:hypothetical protein HK102_006210, partial [Quaeritorhiza haematococci]